MSRLRREGHEPNPNYIEVLGATGLMHRFADGKILCGAAIAMNGEDAYVADCLLCQIEHDAIEESLFEEEDA